MIELIVAHPHAFWLSLGGLLLAAEMLGGNGYLLWSGVAAVITGLVVWLLPVGWEGQGVLFAVLTLVAAWLWWRWLNKRVSEQKPADAHLNQRGQQIVGRRFTLDTTLVNGRGHMRVGDSSWPVVADEDLTAGTQVEVMAVEGITLRVRAC
ncbi:NfeD family protein [Enterobacter cancerogenus]|uniref:NfeD family protein n=1 Tax=Enterobacter cancerogenus TaxID=69218 RepID=UPI000734F7C3|nr:NfeD family protein [Enterobacter cancerogenus]KTQ48530.1 membrane protein [Enterobacter cancerogenus]KTQ48853.1 membrane protein [Enterobacter cancerogenus]KTQ72687.1 membrane protein [Enterobacter cancerogenus]KTQ84219.1 membrane protein [Enterobacter cancerogenus]MDT7011247.1 NfeD family protein [Enterobacter cancerogenus]